MWYLEGHVGAAHDVEDDAARLWWWWWWWWWWLWPLTEVSEWVDWWWLVVRGCVKDKTMPRHGVVRQIKGCSGGCGGCCCCLCDGEVQQGRGDGGEGGVHGARLSLAQTDAHQRWYTTERRGGIRGG